MADEKISLFFVIFYSDLKLGQRGIFAAARGPDNLDVSFGFTRQNFTLKYGEAVIVEVFRVLDKAGNWKICPGV